jgi:superfamily I DNA and/or RNA helicase
MLDIQYRMHPAISRFPSSEFYNFTLQDGSACATLLPPYSALLNELATDPQPDAALDEDGNIITATDAITLPTVRPCPSVVFLDHAGSESTKDRSRVNWNEAYIVCSVIEDLLLNNEVSACSAFFSVHHSLWGFIAL